MTLLSFIIAISHYHFCPSVTTYPRQQCCLLCLFSSRTIVLALGTAVAPLHQCQPHQRSIPNPLIYSLTPRPSSATAASPYFPLPSSSSFSDSRRRWLLAPPPATTQLSVVVVFGNYYPQAPDNTTALAVALFLLPCSRSASAATSIVVLSYLPRRSQPHPPHFKNIKAGLRRCKSLLMALFPGCSRWRLHSWRIPNFMLVLFTVALLVNGSNSL
ncbi:hypothetical protein BHE74_00009413 [Ensete ventricosum]|nr:hypothetical protein GW17_00026575 [Ensete ventricosum]RWW82136.1 hypothetical protein BHE74_00009413 [Ensete ventricosum]RZR86095.1 hypothetical protein BHM03_00013198 [Ensete ventricosum]